MNSFLHHTKYLATGQSAPFTGEWVNVSLSRNAFVVIYSSGDAVDAVLQAKTELNQEPIFLENGEAEAVNFYTITNVSGYADPVFIDSPISNIRLTVLSGSAPVFGYITYQN